MGMNTFERFAKDFEEEQRYLDSIGSKPKFSGKTNICAALLGIDNQFKKGGV